VKQTNKIQLFPIILLSSLLCGFLEPKHSTLKKPVVEVGKDGILSVEFVVLPNEGMKLAASQGKTKAPWKLTIEPAQNFGLIANRSGSMFQTTKFDENLGGFKVRGTMPPAEAEVRFRLRAFVCTKEVGENSQCYPELHKGKISWKKEAKH